MTRNPPDATMNPTNDNDGDDPLPFLHLAAVTRNVMEFLLKDQRDRQNEKRGEADGHDEKQSRGELPVLRRNIGA